MEKKLTKGKKPSLDQLKKIEDGISNWFKEEDSIKTLHEKWEDFHKRAKKFQQYFKQQKLQKIVCIHIQLFIVLYILYSLYTYTNKICVCLFTKAPVSPQQSINVPIHSSKSTSTPLTI